MSVQVYGKAHIYGCSGSFTGLVVATSDQSIQGIKVAKPFQQAILTNNVGERIGSTVNNKTTVVQIDYIPIGGATSNNTIAMANSASFLPSTLSLVNLTGFVDPDCTGDFLYEGGGEVTMVANDIAVVSISLTKYQSETTANLTASKS